MARGTDLQTNKVKKLEVIKLFRFDDDLEIDRIYANRKRTQLTGFQKMSHIKQRKDEVVFRQD